MPIAILFVLIAGGIALAQYRPEYRVLSLAVSAVFSVLFVVYLITTDWNRVEPEDMIAPDQVVLSELAFEQQRLSIALVGRVKNLSETFTLRQADITLTLYDCPEATAPPERCEIIGQDTAPARVDVPPGQLRDFEAVFGFANRAAERGVLVFSQAVTGTRATD